MYFDALTSNRPSACLGSAKSRKASGIDSLTSSSAEQVRKNMTKSAIILCNRIPAMLRTDSNIWITWSGQGFGASILTDLEVTVCVCVVTFVWRETICYVCYTPCVKALEAFLSSRQSSISVALPRSSNHLCFHFAHRTRIYRDQELKPCSNSKCKRRVGPPLSDGARIARNGRLGSLEQSEEHGLR